MELIYIFGSVILVSLMSLVGVLTIGLNREFLSKIILYLVSFSAGSLFGGAFLHLLPEAVKENGFGIDISLALLAGIVVFFLIEKTIHWHHCHGFPAGKCELKSFGYMNLIGDGVHNLIDGMIIAGAYLADTTLGIATTMAVIFHEIPQEIGDFGVLIYSGFTRKKALLMNFVSALTAVIGAGIVVLASAMMENLLIFLLPFAAGNFIYIAGSDLIPELHKEYDLKKSILLLISFIAGIAVMLLLLE
ncbi:MAG: ZIP family metal transporter [Candidatus Diapherotrites archaeon CG10_big_fil_rev_8_21_14_0_10_31_34]|nr:MAG: ZIP family metal transporter [Candidatus Diapherotrites archaeon CG10_big_fil_rev_8_21_14_0_10_31_34]